MKVLISALLFVFSLSSYGAFWDKSVPFKETICQVGTTKAIMLLRFDKNNDLKANDFYGAPMLFLKSKKVHSIEPLANPYPGDFSFTKVKDHSACADTQSFELNKSTIAILYSKDNRPFQDLVRIVVWDAETDKIIDKRELGVADEYFKVANGFAYSKVIPRSDVDSREMISDSGRRMTATDKDLNAFQTVVLNGNQLKMEFDPQLSFARSKWKKFFKDQDEYLKFTGWDPKAKTFKNLVVYEASYFNRKESDILESCIAFTDQRGGGFGRSKWKCLKEKQ